MKRTVFITGATSGIGMATAKKLASNYRLILCGRRQNRLDEIQEELAEITEVKTIQFDVSDKEAVYHAVENLEDEWKNIDILINNAGGPPAGKFEDFTDEDFQNAFELNLLSYVRLIREALPHLKKNGGRIVNFTSSSIKTPIPNLILSNTFRTGVAGLSKTLAEELAPYGILVNVVAPGLIATERIKYLNQMNADKEGRDVLDVEADALKKIPLGRYGTPEEFARAVTWLVSGANTYITGSTLFLDGGMVKAL